MLKTLLSAPSKTLSQPSVERERCMCRWQTAMDLLNCLNDSATVVRSRVVLDPSILEAFGGEERTKSTASFLLLANR